MNFVTDHELAQLKQLLRSHKRLAIFMHSNPDPDALASALILKRIAESFSVRATILLHGIPNQEENHTMIRLLRIPLQSPKRLNLTSEDTLTGLVDCQKSMKNHQFPEDLFPNITLDHHREKSRSRASKTSLAMLYPRVGATASLAMEIYLRLKLPLDRFLATAYAYALLSETRYLSREFTNDDTTIYKQIVPYIDFKILAAIHNTKRPQAFYPIMQTALRRYTIDRHILTCKLSRVTNLDFIHQIAEELIRMENVYLVMVTGVATDPQNPKKLIGKISLRGEHPKLDLGKWLKEALAPYGSAGGHRNMAAGNFFASEKTIVPHVQNIINSKISPALYRKIRKDLALT